MVMPWSISNFLIGPCLIVMLPADGSTLVTWPSIKVDCASASCDQAKSASADSATEIFFMRLSSSVMRHLLARLDHRDLDGRAARREILGTTRRLLDRSLV